MKRLLAIASLSLISTSLWAQSNYQIPPGMPEDTLVASDDFKSSGDSGTLVTLLGIHSFRWMLQIPLDSRTVSLTLSEFDTQTKLSKDVARFAFDPVPPDPSKRDSRPVYFPVVLTLMPDDIRSDEPWRTSWSFVGLLEVPDLTAVIRRSYPNPFRSRMGKLSIFNTTRLEPKSAVRDGYGTAFDIMSTGEGDRYILRATFESSPTLGDE